MRRADQFCKNAVKAVKELLERKSIQSFDNPESVGIILGTRFGPHKTTFSFLDDILDYNDTEVSPTKFSHSVHNAAASYIASVIGVRGPTITVTDFNDPASAVKQLAKAWLKEGRVKYILAGVVEEKSDILTEVFTIEEAKFVLYTKDASGKV